jgi:hypothetical protein
MALLISYLILPNACMEGGGMGGVGGEQVHNVTLHSAGAETYVHKITNVPVFYMALGTIDFDAGKFFTQTIGRGGPS